MDELTAREMQVLELLAKGYSASRIANQLDISLPTVKTHKQNIYYKLNRGNAAGAVWRALELGIIAPPLVRPRSDTPIEQPSTISGCGVQ
jgi:ATP/maltotriose-dependent transcriptional regulator MalT